MKFSPMSRRPNDTIGQEPHIANVRYVTVWERWDPKAEEWIHNHIDIGWSTAGAPVPKSDLQRRAWKNQRWRQKMRIIRDGKLCYPSVKVGL